MIRLIRLAVSAAVLAVPATAQSSDSYDPGRSCHSYVVQRLPVPVRCMAELLGNWSPKPYIDGDLMFRNHEEWLQWQGREDYRHWKNHDYAWHAGAAPQSPSPAAAQTPSPPPPPAQVSTQAPAALFCPAQISARVVLDQASLQGWSGADSGAMLRLDGTPRAEGGTLYCNYGLGRDRITLTRPAWGRCAARTDGTGFDCTP